MKKQLIKGVQRHTSAEAIWAVLHPGPSVATTVAFALCLLFAARFHPAPGSFVLACLGMLAMQCSISVFNDLIDREEDQESAKYKPLARGDLAPGVALALGIGLGLGMVVIFASFGVPIVLYALFGYAIGLLYDVWLKQTPVGIFMLGIAIITLPLIAVALYQPHAGVPYDIIPLCIAVGTALQIADALPDLEADRRQPYATFVTLLGMRALYVCWGLNVIAGAVLLLIGARALAMGQRMTFTILVGFPVVVLVLSLSAWLIYRFSGLPHQTTVKYNYFVQVGAALVVAAGWFTSIIV